MSGLNRHTLGNLFSLALGEVVDNADPDLRGRVQVRLHSASMEVWASVVVPSAGQGYGVSFMPRVGEIVVVAFVAPEVPLVLGSVWSGSESAPPDGDPNEDHYAVRTPAGTVIDFDDADGPSVDIRTDSGYHINITEGDGGSIKIERGSQVVELTSSGIDITAGGKVKVEGSEVEVSAGMVNVNAGMSKFSGVVQADTVIANCVVGTSYTPGAGNIW